MKVGLRMSLRDGLDVAPDVLVIGTGASGLRAAITARSQGCRVIAVSKSLYSASHSIMAEGGVSVALDETDSPELHLNDTLRGGRFLNNREQAELVAFEAPMRMHEAAEFGALFAKSDDGRLFQRPGPGGGHSRARALVAGDYVGFALVAGLLREAVRQGVQFLSDLFLVDLTVVEGICFGGRFLDLRRGEWLQISAGATVLATGGAGRVYRYTTNPLESTGDGYGALLRVGSSLRDMEQVQFHPTAVAWPKASAGLLVTESVRGHGGRLLNSAGERFMENYDRSRLELSYRDVVARAIADEVAAGRGIEGGVYLDISHRGKQYIIDNLPNMWRQATQRCATDISRDPLIVSPACHHFMGGVVIEPRTCSVAGIERLFACGEVVGGTHGANRLGGNALAETQVFGLRAGYGAALISKSSEGLVQAYNESRKISSESCGSGTSLAELQKIPERS